MCVGGGVALATSCDLRISKQQSKVLCARSRERIEYELGLSTKVKCPAGSRKNKRLLLLAEKINSPTAKDWGLIGQLFKKLN